MRRLFLAVFCGLVIFSEGVVAAPGNQPRAVNVQQPQTLQQKRNATRARILGQQTKCCMLIYARLRKMQSKPCVGGDRPDPKIRICLPRKNRYMPYSRWGPNAGRCRARDKLILFLCRGP